MDAILVVAGLLWGLLVKYHPGLAKVPNRLIPYMNFAIALIAKLAMPTEAHAASGVLGHAVSFLTPVAAAGWSSIKSALIYEFFLRAHINLPVPRE